MNSSANITQKKIASLGVDAGMMSFVTTNKTLKRSNFDLSMVVKDHIHGAYKVFSRYIGSRTHSICLAHKDYANELKH